MSFENEIRAVKNSAELRKFVDSNFNKFKKEDWSYVSASDHFSFEIAKKYPDELDWEYLCTFKKIPLDILEANIKKIDWYAVSCFQALTLPFIEKYQHELSLDKIVISDNIQKSVLNSVKQIYIKNNNPEHHKRWDNNLRNNKIFCPKNFEGRYKDYTSSTIPSGTNVEVISIEKSKTKKSTKKKVEKIDYSKLTKSQLKEILSKRGVRTLYHDTLDILREKCKNSE